MLTDVQSRQRKVLPPEAMQMSPEQPMIPGGMPPPPQQPGPPQSMSPEQMAQAMPMPQGAPMGMQQPGMQQPGMPQEQMPIPQFDTGGDFGWM